jgi:hypothetical protein
VRWLGDKAARWWSGVLGGGTLWCGRGGEETGEGLVRCGILWGSSGGGAFIGAVVEGCGRGRRRNDR